MAVVTCMVNSFKGEILKEGLGQKTEGTEAETFLACSGVKP